MKIKISDLKIGTELFQYSNQILSYKITAINVLETGTHTEKFYIAECQSCSDHEKCVVAFKLDDYGSLVYSHMINNYEYDDEYIAEHEHYRNSQYYWHKNEHCNFFLTRKEAQKFILNKNITYCEESIKKSESSIEHNKAEIEKYKTQIEILNEK